MAPSEFTVNSGGPVSPSAVHSNSVLATLKSSIQNTKAKLRALRPTRLPKFTRPGTRSKTVDERERLQRTAHRLSVIEEPATGPNASSSSDELRSDPVASSFLSNGSYSNPSLTARDFEVGGTLGRGKFGRVYLARHLVTDYVCALKIISKAQATTQEEEKFIRRELEIHQNLAHKNILKLLAWFHDDESIYLVLEFAPGGSLYSKMNKQPEGKFTEHKTAIYIAQLTSALRYMHNKNIMHRDIKHENILLGFHGDIKLADFGYSIHSESGFRSTVCGTLDYLSPEVAVMTLKPEMSRGWYTKAIDHWSLGVLMYELLVGKPPFEMKDVKSTQEKIANFEGKGIKFPGHVSERAEELIRELLNLDAGKRMSLDDVMTHPWIVSHVANSVRSGIRPFDQLLQHGA
ncbi:kinase-like domain-containing protein [Alternaria rosae]|uniref:kinase-like domain-containing protein n=1 Tax=Alternaria rosae TaxID=1187941 RepID=UPI001E8EDC41|nr:kinase-like domain-containing protein [Alternaria rosae]KAH6875895.1 kinase-like domain-containing protein [Alternaria rosae]